jgi:hypothetical protein
LLSSTAPSLAVIAQATLAREAASATRRASATLIVSRGQMA